MEGLGDPRLNHFFALDYGLVRLHPADHIVGLDGEHLLEGVRGTVGFERPNLHFAEPLPSELRLAAQRLLGDEGVRPGGACVDFVLHQVNELEHVDAADRDRLIERLARAAVIERGLTEYRRSFPLLAHDPQSLSEQLSRLERGRINAHLVGEPYAQARLLCEAAVGSRVAPESVLFVTARFEPGAHLGPINGTVLKVPAVHPFCLIDEPCARQGVLNGKVGRAIEHRGAGVEAQHLSRAAQVRLQHLSQVHPRRHAHRIQDDVQRGAVGQARHVLDRQDRGDHALVSVAPRHLVAFGDLSRLRHPDAHHRDHAGR